jgi:FlaA1/EpsC-like NDP-sugar epimerase
MRRAVESCRPDVVFHAAALKHVPMLERFPLEAWQTNVLGTLNVLDATTAAGVTTFVNISTDKAANPTNVLGRSKRIGERLVAHAGRRHGRYLSVRFGNVLGSRGSMLITFTEQVARGGPITVTDPEATRYFMTIPEAVRLVVRAVAIGRSGEALVLDMGPPVRIADVASQLMRLAGQPARIVYTGLRAGEKLHEELLGAGEWGERRLHPAITHIAVPPMDPAWLTELAMREGEVAAMSAAAHEQRPVPAPELRKAP